jgi:Spy/CpxP family protein refolding chaperone
MMGMMDKMMGMMDKMMPPSGGAPMPSGGSMPAPAASMKSMSGGAASMTQSSVPGVPGASHLYHIGVTGFFLDHPQHITLTMEQQAGLNKAKERALIEKSAADRAVEQAEQALWLLTAADQPDVTQVEAKIREIEKLRGDGRLAFVRAVGDASKLLTEEQRKSLTGFAPPVPAAAPANSMTAPAAAMPGMKKDM